MKPRHPEGVPFCRLDPMLPFTTLRTFSQHIERNLFFAAFPRACSPSRAILLGASRHRNLRVFPTRCQANKEIGVRLTFGATADESSYKLIRENLGVITWGTRDWMGACARDFRSRDDEGPVNLRFLGVPGILWCRTLDLLDPDAEASRMIRWQRSEPIKEARSLHWPAGFPPNSRRCLKRFRPA